MRPIVNVVARMPGALGSIAPISIVPVSVALVLLALALTQAPQRVAASFASNAGWLALIQAHYEPDTGRAWSEAFSWFYAPARGAPLNRSGYTGAGIFFARNGWDELALAAWRAGESDPAWLVNLGDVAVEAGNPSTAMRFFRGADALTGGEWPRAHIRLGGLCQSALHGGEAYDEAQRQLCRDYFADGNLILNGGFETGDLLGWIVHTRVDAVPVLFGFDANDGVPAPSLIVTGDDDKTGGGLYQRIRLPPQTRVRFSVRAKAQPVPEGQPEGQPFGVQLLTVGLLGRGDVRTIEAPAAFAAGEDWRIFEHIFETPNRDQGVYYFYPAQVSGRGSVWIDEARAEILP